MMKKFFIFCLFLIVFPGCSSMLYHPTNVTYWDTEKDGVHHEDITFAAPDGEKLDAWYFKSPMKSSPKAQIVFFHGNGENLSSHAATLAWILDYGYDYFIFDYEGYGKSTGEPTPEKTVQDGMAAIRYAFKRNPNVPLIVFAQSLGAAVAIRSLYELHHEIPIKFVVVDSGFLSYESAGRSVLSRSWVTWLFQPLAYLLLSDTWAPGDRVTDISPTPLLVMHGDKDQVVGYDLGVDLFDRAHDPKEFWKIDGGHHTDALWGHKGIYRVKFLEKLDQILK